jgi:hypothetical protein
VTPFSKAIPVVITLKLDPGMYRSWYAFARSGFPVKFVRNARTSPATALSGCATRFGSYEGKLYIAMMAPVVGSVTTTDPSRSPSASFATRCTSLRIVSITEPELSSPSRMLRSASSSCASVLPDSTSAWVRSSCVLPVVEGVIAGDVREQVLCRVAALERELGGGVGGTERSRRRRARRP